MTMMSSTSDKKSNFFFANCLQCEGIIRIPITIRPDSAVSCPHCNTQFDLIAYLDQIPEVSVSEGGSQELGSASVSDSDELQIDTDEGIEKQDGKYIVPPQIAAGMRKRRRRRRRSSSESSSQSTPSSKSSSSSSSGSSSSAAHLSEAEELEKERREERARRGREKLQQQREAAALRESAALQEGAQRSRRSGSSKRSTPARNPVLEAAKIIVGGLLAAPIAYLLLMWVFSRDPLSLRHAIHDYAPFLVPSKLSPDNGESLPSAVSAEDEDPTDILSGFDDLDDPNDLEGADIYKSEIKIP